mmetsp:Transcript_59264/g.86746  ORF Transcript_59264/g.86746 Transcript_59264/m.86746 type:complete len:240 (-) Transcript_59264:246-965(-)
MGNAQSGSDPLGLRICACDCGSDSGADIGKQGQGEGSLKAETLATTAAALHNQGENEEAKRLLHEALKCDPGHHFAHHNLGSIYFEEEDNEKALHHFKQSLNDKSPEQDPETACNISITLLKLGRLQEAETFGASAIRGDPENANLHYNMGNVCLQLNKTKTAILHYTKTVQLEPNHADALYNLAIGHQQQGSIDLAIQAYTEAGKRDPTLREYCDQAINALQASKSPKKKKSSRTANR